MGELSAPLSDVPTGQALADVVRACAAEAGLAAVGFARAAPMERTRQVLEERKAAGLHGGMNFTYRNPARSTDPSRALPGARSLVVGAWDYGAGAERGGRALGDGAAPRPLGKVARYATEDHYAHLRGALGKVADLLESWGWRSRVLADDNALVDRAAAQQAGLGWFGKNANILLPGRGSWFVLGSVVTDALLGPSEEKSPGCGACRRCLTSCPTGALIAPGALDARRCLAWLVQAPGDFPMEYREALGDRMYGCDDCQEVCPPNRARSRGTLALGAPPGPEPSGAAHEGADVDLVDLLEGSDEELMTRYGRWYIPGRDPRYLRRNALLVLGNVCHDQPALSRRASVERVFKIYIAHPDELLRSHARWAATRAGRHDLLPADHG